MNVQLIYTSMHHIVCSVVSCCAAGPSSLVFWPVVLCPSVLLSFCPSDLLGFWSSVLFYSCRLSGFISYHFVKYFFNEMIRILYISFNNADRYSNTLHCTVGVITSGTFKILNRIDIICILLRLSDYLLYSCSIL